MAPLLLAAFAACLLASPGRSAFVAPGACVLVGEKDCFSTVQRLASGAGSPNEPKMTFLDDRGSMRRFVAGNDDGTYVNTNSGRVGIDVDAPTQKLHVNGDMRAAVATAHVAMDSRLIRASSISTANSTDQLAALRKLQVRDFLWEPAFAANIEAAPETSRRGIISQETETHIPHAVSSTPGAEVFSSNAAATVTVDKLKLVNYEAILVEAVGSVQELAIENDRLRARVTAQEAALAALTKLDADQFAFTSQDNANLRALLAKTAGDLRAERAAMKGLLDAQDAKHTREIKELTDKMNYMSSVLFDGGV